MRSSANTSVRLSRRGGRPRSEYLLLAYDLLVSHGISSEAFRQLRDRLEAQMILNHKDAVEGAAGRLRHIGVGITSLCPEWRRTLRSSGPISRPFHLRICRAAMPQCGSHSASPIPSGCVIEHIDFRGILHRKERTEHTTDCRLYSYLSKLGKTFVATNYQAGARDDSRAYRSALLPRGWALLPPHLLPVAAVECQWPATAAARPILRTPSVISRSVSLA